MKNTKKKINKKLKSRSGETIAETLVTMIILALAVMMIAGAVVTAARVNKSADNTDTSFRTGTEVNTGTNSPKIVISEENGTGTATGTSRIEIPVTVYQSKNSSEKSYIYYKAK